MSKTKREIALAETYQLAQEVYCIRISARSITHMWWYLTVTEGHLMLSGWDKHGLVGRQEITSPADLDFLPDAWSVARM